LQKNGNALTSEVKACLRQNLKVLVESKEPMKYVFFAQVLLNEKVKTHAKEPRDLARAISERANGMKREKVALCP
jgi:hypothetical protein